MKPSSRPATCCLDGRCACPPEDVGGTGGYGQFLEAIGHPSREDHAWMLGWGRDFDPERFDGRAVNTALWRPDLRDR